MSDSTYRFGSCVLDCGRRELLVDGVPRSVEPQVFDLLEFMIENRGRLITPAELVEAIWRGRAVSDSAIAARISAARRAVDDSGRTQAVIRTLPRKGFRFVADVEASVAGTSTSESEPGEAAGRQTVRFARSADGTRIAFASTGSGPSLVRAGHWLTHLEHDWRSPIWRPLLDRLGERFRVVRYDQRGTGLSDWDVKEFGLSRFVEDLESVVDAAGIGRFVLFAASQGVPVAVCYAARHPDRVSRLVLHGGYVQGRLVRASDAERSQGEAILTLMRHGWAKAGSPFLKAFTTMYIPGGSPEQTDSLVELQRITASMENAVAIRSAVDTFDVTDVVSRVSVPTLVTHARNDGVHPLDQGRALAAGIPGSEFVLLESGNHVLLPQEPAWEHFFDAVRRFTE